MDAPRLIDAKEVERRLGVSRARAYEVIRELNAGMAAQGKAVIAGRVDERLLDRAYFADLGEGSE